MLVRDTPAISVVFPARNEGARVAQTVASLVNACNSPHHIEVVIVDDFSLPDRRPNIDEVAKLVPVKLMFSSEHLGVGAARNLAVGQSRGDMILITDAHVHFSPGWDSEVARIAAPNRILAATIRDKRTDWRGFGCSLVVPHMGTRWNNVPPSRGQHVQVASSAGTILERTLFDRLGGYDDGMLHYGGFEPEFSVRAWRSGAEIVAAPDIEISHRFKGADQRREFTTSVRTAMTHNCLRFGVAHLPAQMILEMVRVHATEFPSHIQPALRLLEERGAWRRRDELAANLPRDFIWFVEHFALRDQVGSPIPALR